MGGIRSDSAFRSVPGSKVRTYREYQPEALHRKAGSYEGGARGTRWQDGQRRRHQNPTRQK
jgi:hypothetical protein